MMKNILYLSILLIFQNTFGQNFLSFTTSGTLNQYVPVIFRSTKADGGNTTFYISRPNIHETRYWLAHGIVAITGIGNGWGSNGNGLRVDNFTYGHETSDANSKITSFLGRVICAKATNNIIVFLRGGTLYYYANAEIISDTGSYQDAAGQNFASVSIHDPLYNLPKGIFYGDNDINAKTSNLVALGNGNVGIGTSNPTNKLDVNGILHAKEVKVDLQNWPDYVFEKDYNLRSLDETEKYIESYGHLPDIPSAAHVKENGVSLGEMNAKVLEKIEELTLHVIELNKEIRKLKKENVKLKNEIIST